MHKEEASHLREKVTPDTNQEEIKMENLEYSNVNNTSKDLQMD